MNKFNLDDELDLDFDDEEILDADQDHIKHLVMQLRAALDVAGDYLVHFRDGSKHKLSLNTINEFLEKYETLKPNDKDNMQKLASTSKDAFEQSLSYSGETRPHEYIKYSSEVRSRSGGLTQYG